VASAAYEGLTAASDRHAVLLELTAAVMATGPGARVRVAHKTPAAVTLPDTENAGSATVTMALPGGLARRQFTLSLPPDWHEDLLQCCATWARSPSKGRAAGRRLTAW